MARPRGLKLLVGVVAAAVVLVMAGTYVYIHFIEGPAPSPLTLRPKATDTSPTGPVDGDWEPTKDSTVGYRVKEVLFGQSTTAVERTNAVSGSMTIAGTSLTAAEFTVDMTTVTSDRRQRDRQFNGRVMETDRFPTSTFVLTSPVDFGAVASQGATISAKASGKLTLKGTTKTVTVELTADRKGELIEVNGSFAINFPDWKIDNPSFGPASVGDDGSLEFLLVLARTP